MFVNNRVPHNGVSLYTVVELTVKLMLYFTLRGCSLMTSRNHRQFYDSSSPIVTKILDPSYWGSDVMVLFIVKTLWANPWSQMLATKDSEAFWYERWGVNSYFTAKQKLREKDRGRRVARRQSYHTLYISSLSDFHC